LVNVDNDTPAGSKCVFSVVPFTKETVIAFKPPPGSDTMTKQLAAPFRESFEFGTSSEADCKIDKLYVFFETTSSGIPVNDFVALSDSAWTQTFKGPGRIR